MTCQQESVSQAEMEIKGVSKQQIFGEGKALRYSLSEF